METTFFYAGNGNSCRKDAARHVSTMMFITSLFIGMVSCGGDGADEETDDNAIRMQAFVADISSYARGLQSGFIIIPQNAPELAFNNTDPDEGKKTSYVDAIDGIGIEELFYNGALSVDRERLGMLQTLKSSVTIMVADFVSNNANLPNALKRCKDEGFIAFPRSADNYDYELIPAIDSQTENSDDVNRLSDAKNYLYLISTNRYANKQAMLNAVKATNYDVVLIDLFFDEVALAPADIQSLKTKANGGKRLVISYISIGSAENYRYYWQRGWGKGNPSWLKKPYEGYADELWVEFWHSDWQNIIFGNNESYIKKIINAGFDGAYLDNVEAYYFLIED